MSDLNNSELLLLSNFIYLKWDKFKNKNVGKIVHDMLYRGKLNAAIVTNGECVETVKRDEWINVLRQIKDNSNLTSLKIENIKSDNSGIRTACFVDNHSNNATVVFRGTKTKEEWGDNGQGAYKIDTPDQIIALDYVNSLTYHNITVTGHSKGGNKAKYVALLCDKVNKCVSFDGQGFSNEFTDKYEKFITKNNKKIISISAKYDYVNCLLNSLDEEKIYIDTKFQSNPLYYHKASIMLDGNGNLRPQTKQCIFSNIIYNFSTSLISDTPEPYKSFTINGMIEIIELFLCGIKLEQIILKIVGDTVLTLGYTKHYKLKKEFTLAYYLLSSLITPFMFWNDFVKAEESKSKELLDQIILKINNLEEGIVEKVKKIGDEGEQVAYCISNANSNFIKALESDVIM
ncbi:Mbeg1-like protein [Clostridium uliginosum]|uniref:DUF2974 domain-containing protein n=1 Tax=Clostridium uliginosum TaxID=119641 RepID=A0A1I1GYM5_9CLOT|nr:Mbeg1-like protein [Clostridium uliginosum]SFC16949.1 Protein of unknown function [Clostridium uliginosum]